MKDERHNPDIGPALLPIELRQQTIRLAQEYAALDPNSLVARFLREVLRADDTLAYLSGKK